MKSLLMAAFAVAFALPAYADDTWRSPGSSLYGGPSGDAMSQEFQNRGRLDEALREGKAGYTGDTTIVTVETVAAGCISTQSTKVEGATETDTDSDITCNNTNSPVSADTTVNIGTIKR